MRLKAIFLPSFAGRVVRAGGGLESPFVVTWDPDMCPFWFTTPETSNERGFWARTMNTSFFNASNLFAG